MHTDPELLALLAVGDDAGTAGDHAHLASCALCGSELAALRRVSTLARTAAADPLIVAPRPQVWARIRAELALSPTLEPSAAARDSSPITDVPPPLGSATPDPSAGTGPAQEPAGYADLDAVEPAGDRASGRAELHTDRHGRRLLRVVLHVPLPASGVRQAWLVHRDDPLRRQSVGILDGSHGLWTVDHSIDLHEYSVLDISQQDDGELVRPGSSIARGQLTLVG